MDLRGILQDLAKDLLGDQKMSDDDFEKIYEMIEDKVDNEPPPRFAFIGETGVGKSSTLNGSMSDAEVRIAAKSEASLRAFVSGLFRSIAELFGYVVGEVIGFGRDIVKAIGGGWQKGFNAGLR